MPGLSIHVVDVAGGRVAQGMRVEVRYAEGEGCLQPLADGPVSASGLLEDERLARRFAPGRVQVRFHVAHWYRQAGSVLPQPPFLDVVVFDFGLADPAAHYHLPFKCTPWGYSCFRGVA